MRLGSRIRLLKMPVSLMSATVAFLGYILCANRLSAFPVALSVFMLSAGAASLNHCQDRNMDAMMERTRKRPIPSGDISYTQALIQTIVLMISGFLLLIASSISIAPAIIGLFTIILYNAIYTPFKKNNSPAFLPGVISGMLPPSIGWLAAGGDFFHPQIWYIMILLAIWQVPHTWLIILSYPNDYKNAGIPTILDSISEITVKKLLFLWVLAFAVSTLFSRLFILPDSRFLHRMILGNAIVLSILFSFYTLRYCKKNSYRFLFHCLNASMLLLVLMIIMAVML